MAGTMSVALFYRDFSDHQNRAWFNHPLRCTAWIENRADKDGGIFLIEVLSVEGQETSFASARQ